MKHKHTWKIEELVNATGGKLVAGTKSGPFSGISTDSRKAMKSEVFLALRGENFDAHTFIPSVIERGIQCIIADQVESIRDLAEGTCGILVENTLKALGDIAAYKRQNSNVSVVAVTGSNGKTTTKEILASIFTKKYNTLYTKGNLNNEIGLPLTLLNLTHEHQWAIAELGMNQKGEIERLSEICRPDTGIITNVGQAHIEFFGSLEKIAEAKGEILPNINRNGTAILNFDNPMYGKLKELSRTKIIHFGLSEDADVRALDIKTEHFSTNFTLSYQKTKMQMTINQPGTFMVYNCLAAASAAIAAGIDLETIRRGISDFSTISGRMNILPACNDVVIIDDTYNASPDSMIEAVHMLSRLTNPGRKILVSGEMLELGEKSGNLHFETGKRSAKSGIDFIFALGKYAEFYTNGAIAGGMDKDCTFTGTKKEIIDRLKHILKRDDILLIKGSRGMKMEEIINPITHFLKKRQN